MAMTTLDLRNLACPEPVVRVKKAIEEGPQSVLEVLVTSAATVANVTRMAQSLGAAVASEQVAGGDYRLSIAPGAARHGEEPATQLEPCPPPPRRGRATIFIKNNVMGLGNERLGRILMKAFLKTLKAPDHLPAEIICVNNGVHLSTEGSEELATLRELAEMGVEIISCGTCLDFFGRLDKVRVGVVGNMFDIVARLTRASSIITP